jgi:metal-sulfur cluster biosynthetic enzyme
MSVSETLQSQVETALRDLIDPEVGMNVVDLGLLYEVSEEGPVLYVDMIPTTAGCPLLHALTEGARELLTPAFPHHQIQIRWRLDVDWTPDRIRR